MSFINNIVSVIFWYFCGNVINLLIKCDSIQSTENLRSAVGTNLSHEMEDVKIPLRNENQVNINYDDLMNILENADSAYQAFENITKTYTTTPPESSDQQSSEKGNPYFPSVLPKLHYDAEKNLILVLTCIRGMKNRLVDGGDGRLIVKILAPDYIEAFDAEISRFLSSVLQVSRLDIFVTKGFKEGERKVVVTAKAVSEINPLYQILEVLEPPE